MSKTKNRPPRENKSPEQLKDEMIDKKVAEDIQKILIDNKRGLQPFLQVSEFGIVPRVRLAKGIEDPHEENKPE